MAENTPAIAAETPVVYKRFSQADKISQGTNNAALSLNDYIPGQHVTGPNQNDIAATLAQLQAIPIGTATLSGNTYNVTISNYPNSATIYPGQKISVQFQNDAPTAEDTALNLSAFGKSLPMCARGIRMGRGSIKAGMVLNFIYWPDKWNADYDLVENVDGVLKYAGSSSVYNKQSVDSTLNGALANYQKKTILTPQDIDFNNLQEQGLYTTNRIDMNSVAWVSAAWENAPTSKPQGGFSLTVIKEGNYLRQIYSFYDKSIIYIRQQGFHNSRIEWSAWENLVTTSDLNNYIKSKSFYGKTIDLSQLQNGKWICYLTLLHENSNYLVEIFIQKTSSTNAYIKILSNYTINVNKNGMKLTITGDTGVYSQYAVWSFIQINSTTE